MKKKNISTIYKQLAKLFHPDLEQDEQRKLEKILLMQELTAAYEAKDLHALLSLELTWIHKENDHLEQLAEDKLAVYLQILKEQIEALTEQKRQIVFQPQYATLVDEFGWEVRQYPLELVQKHIKETSFTIRHLQLAVTVFKSDNALRHIKAMIKDWRNASADAMDEEDLWQMLYGR